MPYVDIKLHTVDLGIVNRDTKNDSPIQEAMDLLKEHKIGIKCSTMTLTQSKVKEVDLKRVWKPASAQIRHVLDSTTFQNPIKF
jgi:isocitrate dehydrogenase